MHSLSPAVRIAVCELSDVTVIISRHLLADDGRLSVHGLWNQMLVEKLDTVVAYLLELGDMK